MKKAKLYVTATLFVLSLLWRLKLCEQTSPCW